jgi:5'-3' exoribonuclease 2
MIRLGKISRFVKDSFVNIYVENFQVILSDSNVPGEGEHKIIEYIRQQRLSPNYNPNTAHCVCGVDADLIMLGLATHEVNFTILREEFLMDQPRPCELCQQFGHNLSNCNGSKTNGSQLTVKQKDFLFVRLSVLRGYLDRDFYSLGLPFEFDLERVVDDWIFLCFFVGNDFLPHLPSLEIYEGAINRLVTIYRELSHKLGG